MVAVRDDDVADQVHHARHHGEAGQGAQQRGRDARPPDDLTDGSRRRLDADIAAAGRQQLGHPARIGPDAQHQPETCEREPDGREPGERQRVAGKLAPCQQRIEDQRAEDRAHHGPAQHECDARGPLLRRIHVSSRRPHERERPERRAQQHEAGDRQRREHEARADPRHDQAAGRHHEPDCERRDPPEPIHSTPRLVGGERSRDEEDRRPEPEQAVHAGHLDEGERGDGRDELEHAGQTRHRPGEQDRVPPDRHCRELVHVTRITPG